MSTPDWTALESGIESFLADALGISVEKRTGPQGFVQGPSATYDLLASTSVGVDDVRWEDDDPVAPTGVIATAVGNREITMQVTVWSDSQMLAQSARAYLESLRTKIRLPSAKATLRSLGLALVRIEDVVQVDPVEDGRARSQASLDVRLAYRATESDEPTPYVEAVHLTSNYTDPAGDALGSALQLDIDEATA